VSVLVYGVIQFSCLHFCPSYRSINIRLPYVLWPLNIAVALMKMMVITVNVRSAHSVSAHAI
jgi:hypothetical protein